MEEIAPAGLVASQKVDLDFVGKKKTFFIRRIDTDADFTF